MCRYYIIPVRYWFLPSFIVLHYGMRLDRVGLSMTARTDYLGCSILIQ